MKGDFHVRFRENVGVKFPCVTRLAASQKDTDTAIYDQEKTTDKETASMDNDCNFPFSNDWDFDCSYRY